MTVKEILVWLENQSDESIADFNEGMNFYRWGEDLPEHGEFSVGFKIGWQFAWLQQSN